MEFDIELNMSDPDFADKLREAIGVKDGEKIQLLSPQFDREDGRKITYFPSTFEEYEFLKEFSEANLKKLGCQVWDKEDDKTYWLYPHEWYNYIPDGLEVTDIFGEKEVFQKGVTDDDKRFGALSFGFVQSME